MSRPATTSGVAGLLDPGVDLLHEGTRGGPRYLARWPRSPDARVAGARRWPAGPAVRGPAQDSRNRAMERRRSRETWFSWEAETADFLDPPS